MADISTLNLNETDYNIKDAYVRSLIPSTADPTTNKLATMADTSGGYVLPTASASELGGIKVGSGLSINNGVLSASGGGITRESIYSSGYLTKSVDNYKFIVIRGWVGVSSSASQGVDIPIASTSSSIALHSSHNYYYGSGTFYMFDINITINNKNISIVPMYAVNYSYTTAQGYFSIIDVFGYK